MRRECVFVFTVPRAERAMPLTPENLWILAALVAAAGLCGFAALASWMLDRKGGELR